MTDIIQQHWKKAALISALTLPLMAGSCSDDATIASANISKAADNFEIERRIVFLNGITDNYILNIEGRCNINVDEAESQLEVTCKTGENADGSSKVKKHFLGLSDNVTYFVEQMDPADVSTYHYRVTFKPQSIIPDVDFRGSAKELANPSRPDTHNQPVPQQKDPVKVAPNKTTGGTLPILTPQ